MASGAHEEHGVVVSAGPRPWQKYDRLASTYDARWAKYVRVSTGRTLEHIAVQPGQTVLDVGCGTGQLLAALDARGRGARLLGMDPSTQMIDAARRRLDGAIGLTRCTAEAMAVESASVDWLVTTNMFHYVRDPQAARREFRRVLRPGGTLVLTDWCDDFRVMRLRARWEAAVDPAFRHVYGTLEMQALLVAGGFDVAVIDRYKIGWSWGLMTVVAKKALVQRA